MTHSNSFLKALCAKDISDGLNTKVIGRELLVLDCVDSTMHVARDKVKNGVSEGFTIFAEQQLSGKGRRGREWVCPEHKGLLFTVIIKPDIPADYMRYLMGFTSVAVSGAITHLYKLPVKVKWPNDILINDKKVAGILIEANGSYNKRLVYSIGVGVNVNLTEAELPDVAIIKPTSLALEVGHDIDRIKLARTLLQTMDVWYSHLMEKQYEFIRERWRELCLQFDKNLHIVENNNEYCGRLVDISPKGDIVLVLTDGERKSFKCEFVTVNLENSEC